MFDIDEDILDKFGHDATAKLLNLINAKLDDIENAEIQELYDQYFNNWENLESLIVEIKGAQYYGANIVESWHSKITDRIAFLQDKEVEDKFNLGHDNYIVIVELFKFVEGNRAVAVVKKKWKSVLKEKAMLLQHKALDDISKNLSGKKLDELKRIIKLSDKYNFDITVLNTYKSRIQRAILNLYNKTIEDKFNDRISDYDGLVTFYYEVSNSQEYPNSIKLEWCNKIGDEIVKLQSQVLNQLLSSIDALEYDELIALYKKARHYSYNRDVLKSSLKHIDELIDKKEAEHIKELGEGIESYTLTKLKVLEADIKALKYREKNTRNLLSKLQEFIQENSLREKCTPGSLANCDPDQLDDLMGEVHFSGLPKNEKERIFSLISQMRKANEQCENDIRKVTLDSKPLMIQCVKDTLKSLQHRGVFIDAEITYADDSTILSKIEHISKEDWKDGEEIIAHIKMSRKRNSGIDWLLTTKAFRQERCKPFWLSSYKLLEACGHGPEECNLHARWLPETRWQDYGSMFANGSKDLWSMEGGIHISNVFDRLVNRIREIKAQDKKKIRAIKLKHQNDLLMLGSEGDSLFSIFAKRYSPNSVVTLSDEQIKKNKYLVHQSKLTQTQKNILLHVLDENERHKKRLEESVLTYNKNFLNQSCEKIRKIVSKYPSNIPKMMYNDNVNFRRELEDVKKNFFSGPFHDMDLNTFVNDCICMFRCDPKGTFVLFTRYQIQWRSKSDFYYSDGTWGRYNFINIFKMEYQKRGFTYSPEILMYMKNEDVHNIIFPELSNDKVKSLTQMCFEICELLKVDAYNSKINERDADRRNIVKYLEDKRKKLAVHYASAWESMVLPNSDFNDKHYSEYMNKCAEFERQYYEEYPLKLNFDYFKIAIPKVISSGIDNVEDKSKPSTNNQDLVGGTDVVAKKKPSSEEIQHVVQRLIKADRKMEAVKFLQENANMGFADAKKEVEKYCASSGTHNVVKVSGTTDSLVPQAVNSELIDSDVRIKISSLMINYPDTRFLAIGSAEFAKTLSKAKAAYAKMDNEEKPLVMYDSTIFGSAKEGFVLTDRNVYINISGCKNKCISIADIKDVHNTHEFAVTDVNLATSSGDYCITFRSNKAEAEACRKFLIELLTWMKSGSVIKSTVNDSCANGDKEPRSESACSKETSKWLCNCGTVNTGNFCGKCGSKKDSGVLLWTCSCGALNKGKFCPKCGSPRKES